MKTMQTMHTMKTMKGSIGVLALLFAASFLLLLPGCQGPAAPQADSPGTVSLTIGQLDMSRAIQPDIDLSGFTGGFTAVFERAGHDDVTVNFASGATTAQAELPQGEWELTVSARIGAVVAATYGPRTVNVQPGLTPVTAVLVPIFTGGNGTFSWYLTVPSGTTGNLEVRAVDGDGDIVLYPLKDQAAFDGSPAPTLWDASLPLPAGAYFVRFVLDHGTYGRAVLGSDLHVYQGMTSNIARTLASTHFRLGLQDTVIESAAVTVTAPATGATPYTAATIVGADVNFNASTVTWNPDHSPFRGGTPYTATITLTAHIGHTFTGGLTTATINGHTATVTNTGATATLAFTFQPTETDPVIAAWQFGTADGDGPTNNPLVTASIEGGNASRPSGGQQQADARLQFLTQSGSDLTPRTLSGGSSGINVSGLDGLSNNAWWQTAISTTGRTDIAVTWRMRSTGTGPRDWRLQYRVGGTGAWNNVGGTIALSSPTTPANTLNEPQRGRFLPPTAEGHDRLYLRWLMTSNVRVNPTPDNELIAPGGTHQINDLVIRSGAESIDNENDPTGTFNVTWTGFSNPLLAQGVNITGSATIGTISISAPENAFTNIQWLDGNMLPLGNGEATLSLPSDDFPPLVTVRVRTAGSSRTYSIVFDTATGAVF